MYSEIIEKSEIKKMVIWVVIGCIAVVFLFGVFRIVPPGHRGVLVTLGKVSETARGEGLNLKLPLIQKIKIIPIKQITVDGTASCFSSDLQRVDITYSVLYKIQPNAVVELYRSYQGSPYVALVEPRIQDVLKQNTAKYRAEDVVKNRDMIRTMVIQQIQKSVEDLIVIVDVPIKNIDLSNELESAIEQKQVQEQQALAKTYELQKANKQAEITIVNAKAEAEAVRIKGSAVAQNPKVIELEIANKWNGISPTTVVVSSGGANVLLPLK